MTAYGFLLKTKVDSPYTMVFLRLNYKSLDGYLFLGTKGTIRDLLSDTLIDYPVLYITQSEKMLSEEMFYKEIDEIYKQELSVQSIIKKEDKQRLINDLKIFLNMTDHYPYDHFYKLPMDKVKEEKETVINLHKFYYDVSINQDNDQVLATAYAYAFEDIITDLLPFMLNYMVFIEELLT